MGKDVQVMSALWKFWHIKVLRHKDMLTWMGRDGFRRYECVCGSRWP